MYNDIWLTDKLHDLNDWGFSPTVLGPVIEGGVPGGGDQDVVVGAVIPTLHKHSIYHKGVTPKVGAATQELHKSGSSL